MTSNFRERLDKRFVEETPLREALLDAFENLYHQNVPRLTPEPTPGTLAHARWRDVCNKLENFDHQYMENYCLFMMQNFTAHLPSFLRSKVQEVQYTVPLIDLIPDLHEFIDQTLYIPLWGKNVQDILPTIQDHHIDHSPRNKDGTGIRPKDYKGDPLVFVHGTPFAPLFDVQIPISISQETRFSGTWIVAPPGRGKTHLLLNMISEDLMGNASIVLMDSKGDLIEPIRHLKSLKDNFVIIEPDPDYALALNPLDVGQDRSAQTVSLLSWVFGGLLAVEFTGLQETLFRCCIRACLYEPNPTVMTFRQIALKGPADISRLPPDLQDFFQTEFPDAKTYGETKKQIGWRLRLLMENPIIAQMFTAPKTKLNLEKAMSDGKIIIIDANKDKLSEEGSRFLQRFFVALVLRAAQQRSRSTHKRPCFVYIDEAQNAVDPKLATILDECRSQKIGLTLAHQRDAQITDDQVRDALKNCAVRLRNDGDLPVGHFSAYIRDMGTFTLRIPRHLFDKMPRMGAEEEAALKAKMRNLYYHTQEAAPQKSEPVKGDDLSTASSKDW